MHSSLVILLCCLSAVLANPLHRQTQSLDGFLVAPVPIDEPPQFDVSPDVYPNRVLPHRYRRQLDVQGGGSPGKGVDINANARVPVWTSDNGRHSIDATGGYTQHLGGPYGNSRPDFRAGAGYTFRF